jgi:Domain of unknown function (DUF1772)
MIEAIGLVAALSAYLFAGAAIYISLVEHPARMLLDTRTAALQWAPSYRRATYMQAPLAVLSLVAGIATWTLTHELAWLIAALLIGLVVPFTFIIIMPTNHKLLSPGRDLSSDETRMLLTRWGQLHWVRTVLSILASAIYLWRASAA